MNRKDFVLVWKENNIIYCNQKHCFDNRQYRLEKRVTEFCPFDLRIIKCDDFYVRNIPSSVYNNKTCIPIATLKDCKGRQFGCEKECNTCIVQLIQKIYHSKKENILIVYP